MEHIKEELADVLIYSIDLANAYGIDMTQMIMNKLVKNAEKYPTKITLDTLEPGSMKDE